MRPNFQNEQNLNFKGNMMGVSSEAEFSKRTKTQGQRNMMGSPVRPNFQNEQKLNFKGNMMGVSGEAEFSKRTKTQLQKPWGYLGGGGWMGPIPEFQSEHGVLGLREFSKLTNCQISKTMGI